MLTVYTAIFGRRDRLLAPTFRHPEVKHLCFTDDPANVADGVETVHIPSWEEWTPNRQAKWFKLHPPTDDTLWIDGSYRLIGDPRPVFESVDALGLGKHPWRDCTYTEARECRRHRLDDIATIEMQMDAYRSEGFPERWGLWEGGLIFRRMAELSVRQWQTLWWREICAGSRRDQLSLPYSLWRTGVKVTTLTPRMPSLVEFHDHGKAK
ncbi:MAG: DUF616 domain-containing protein [Planctomycetaceae bacterium]|nr:DUF616 domain-containing protein [Planctomycetaceae bacterium]